MEAIGLPKESVTAIKDSIDCNLYFFDNKVEISDMYIILGCSVAVLIGVYIIFNIFLQRKTVK